MSRFKCMSRSRDRQDHEVFRMGRRQALKTLGLAAVVAPWANEFIAASLNAADDLEPLNRFPRMVQEYFVQAVRDAERQNELATWRVSTKEQAEKYVTSVRARIRQSFGPEPKRTDLKAEIVDVLKRDGYNIEKLIYESRPGFPVTANLYVPTGQDQPVPGVVGTCGHSYEGKAAEAYQSFAQGLARQGYACLIYDPIGQGERFQYVNDELKSRIGAGVREHLHAGNQQFLVGEFIGMWRAWDGIRALDYLQTRKEIDPKQIAVTGNSGGGTMTTWLCGVEQRWSMAAPSCFVTTFLRNTENELPADTEQCPPRALALGLDHADFLAALAPKPIIILAKERDYFDARGSESAFARLKHLYTLLGQPDNIELFEGPTTHGYSQENREAMYRWFNKFSGASQADAEPTLELEDVKTLWCTPKGQVAALDNTRTVFDFTKVKSKQLTQQRGLPEGASLLNAVRDVLRIPEDSPTPPNYRILRNIGARKYPTPHAITYVVETELNIQLPVYMLTNERWYSRPPLLGDRAILYISHRSADAELRNEPLVGEIMKAEEGVPLFACDVRGVGETRPNTCGNNTFDSSYGCDYFYAIHSLMLDRPYLGQKTFDVLRIVQWLDMNGYSNVHVIGKGWGALSATFAALLSDKITQVTLKNSLVSYSSIAESEEYDWPLATLLPNVLAKFDLPDCYRALEAKKLRQIEPWEAILREKQ